MKKYLPILLLLSVFFSTKSYTQNTTLSLSELSQHTTSVDEDAMNWQLSYDFMGINKRASQATCTGDVTPPVITCSQDLFVQATSSCGVYLYDYSFVSASDNCSGVSVQCNPPGWSYFSVGTTTVTCTATDASNNSSSCAFDVFVWENVPPTISCPQDLFVQGTNNCGAVVSYFPPSVSDNCWGASVQCYPPPGSLFSTGTNTVYCTATDLSNNNSFCTFNIFVSNNTPPVITCPQDIFVQATSTSSCGTVVDYPFPSVNCQGLAIQCYPPPTSFFSVGTNTVTCTATDGANNTDACTFDIFVSDSQPAFISCPNDIVVQPDPNSCTAVVNWAYPIISNNCNSNFQTVECYPASGSTFPVGTHTIFCIAYEDGFILGPSCEFDILVTDDCFDNCPQNILLLNTTATGLHQAQNAVTAINVTTGTNTTFKAGDCIGLHTGFTAPANTDFSGEIEDCTTNFGTDEDQK